MKRTANVLSALPLFLAACSLSSENRLPGTAEAVLREATSLEILALDPTPLSMRGESAPPAEAFHGYAIQGRATLTDAKACAELAVLVLRAVRESDGTVAACFNPRHGLRAAHGGETLELVICFECLSMHVRGSALPAGMPVSSVPISSAVEAAVSRIYADAGARGWPPAPR